MTKKDFEAIARILKHAPFSHKKDKSNVIEHFSVRLHLSNPKFKPGIFIKACGGEERCY